VRHRAAGRRPVAPLDDLVARRWYGDRYPSIGVMLRHGTVDLRPGAVAELLPPAPEWFEAPLATSGRQGRGSAVRETRRRATPPRPGLPPAARFR
jgi:hypothetical protein